MAAPTRSTTLCPRQRGRRLRSKAQLRLRPVQRTDPCATNQAGALVEAISVLPARIAMLRSHAVEPLAVCGTRSTSHLLSIVHDLPSVARIEAIDVFDDLFRRRPEVDLIDDALLVDRKRRDAGFFVFDGPSQQGETGDQVAVNGV